jgi:hypothetical protein
MVSVVTCDDVPAGVQEWNTALDSDEPRSTRVLQGISVFIETTKLHGSERELRTLLRE